MMPKSPNSERIDIPGPAGRLEALIEVPADEAPSGMAVVLHPHPQHGGTMHNKVAHTLARTFVRLGFAALRFNFRGTEGSDGEYDHGNGEFDDALAAIDWLRQRYPDQPLWLSGFSFGAAIAVRVALETELDGLVSVAPAVHRFGNGLDGQPRCPWLVVQGDEDELVDVDDIVDWINGLGPGPELIVIDGAEHFFHGRLIDLRDAVSNFVTTRQSSSRQ